MQNLGKRSALGKLRPRTSRSPSEPTSSDPSSSDFRSGDTGSAGVGQSSEQRGGRSASSVEAECGSGVVDEGQDEVLETGMYQRRLRSWVPEPRAHSLSPEGARQNAGSRGRKKEVDLYVQ